jgi:hypothetical protein
MEAEMVSQIAQPMAALFWCTCLVEYPLCEQPLDLVSWRCVVGPKIDRRSFSSG